MLAEKWRPAKYNSSRPFLICTVPGHPPLSAPQCLVGLAKVSVLVEAGPGQASRSSLLAAFHQLISTSHIAQ
jgi:hypothetical protein